jgi:hypothetical protein
MTTQDIIRAKREEREGILMQIIGLQSKVKALSVEIAGLERPLRDRLNRPIDLTFSITPARKENAP